ncbi:Cleavage and polyadenylation specificity factor subunit 1 [Rhizophlyctis rosea]|nr:Cleavage and polyadenylation specificity factor subunit 1 [Rhizophlyctis rosea]
MSSIYSLYKELLPPTGVQCCAEARFTSPYNVNLLIAKGSMLEVYDVVQDDKATGGDGGGDQTLSQISTQNENTARKTPRLELRDQFKLHGNIMSIGVIRTSTSVGLLGMDSLLLSFKDAKMSLIEYSVASQNIVTVSIHFYEREEFKKEALTDKWIPVIHTDPQNRCAALNFYNDRLAILPFKQEGDFANVDADDTTSKYPFLPSYVISVSAIEQRIRNVNDMTFLHDYFEPTLVILYETVQTWTGRLAARRDTKSLIAVSLDITQRNYPVLFRVDHLPYNCTNLLPVPSPVGGVLVFSPNCIIYMDQTTAPGVVCAVNSYYGTEANFPPPPSLESGGAAQGQSNPLYSKARVSDFKHLGLALDGCQPYFLNPDTVLIVLRSGEMVVVELVGEEEEGSGWKRRKSGVKRFNVRKLGLRAVAPSCGCRVGDVVKVKSGGGVANGGGVGEAESLGHSGVVFVGSRIGDSLLIQFTETGVVEVEEVKEEEEEGDKKSSPTTLTSSKLLDEIDEDIYGDADDMPLPSTGKAPSTHTSATTSPRIISHFRFRITDFLLCTAPIRDAVMGEPTVYSTYAFEPEEQRKDLEIVTCSGEGESGALGVLQRNVRPIVQASFEMGGVGEIWCVGGRRRGKGKGKGKEGVVGEEGRRDVGVEGEREVEGEGRPEEDIVMEERIIEEGDKEQPPAANGVNGKDIHPVDETHDRFMILSKETGTMIFTTGEELRETKETEFHRDGPTVAVGTVLDGEVYVQVYPEGILLLDTEGKRLEELPVGGQDRWVVSCSIMDPYILVLMNVGEVALFVVDEGSRALSTCPGLSGSPISACCLYCDDLYGKLVPTVGEWEEQEVRREEAFGKVNSIGRRVARKGLKRKQGGGEGTRKRRRESVDREVGVDVDLYGLDGGEGGDGEEGEGVEGEHGDGDCGGGVDDVAEKRYWCFIYREDGTLEIFRIPDFEQVYYFPHFDLLPSLVYDHYGEDVGPTQTQPPAIDFNEILVVNLGRDHVHKDPYFIARTDDADLIIYKLYTYVDPDHETTPTRLALRLTRIPHTHISRLPKSYTDTEGDKLHAIPTQPRKPTFLKKHYLKPFRGIGTMGGRVYEGVFMCGERACWVLCGGVGGVGPRLEVLDGGGGERFVDGDGGVSVSGKRGVKVHPFVVDGGIKCFCGVNNGGVEGGFGYINSKNLLRICNLPPHFVYDTDWPYCKVPLRRTPQHLTYQEASKTYVVATSVAVPFRLSRARYSAAVAAGVIEDGDDMPESEEMKRNGGVKDEDRDSGMYWPTVGAYALELISPVTWETADLIRMDEHEHVLCVQAVNLQSKQTASGKKMFLAVGTGYVRGEDLATRGRIFVYDIIDVVPDPERPQANHRFKQMYVNEEKGPVTALCNVGGYLVAAIGTKIIIHTFEDEDSLTGVAFIDVNMYVHSICAIKNMILVSDIMKSVWFLGFQEDPPKLVLLGKDYHPMKVYASEFLIDDQMLGFLVGDGDMNLHVMTYAPYNIQSSSGQKLIRRGDFHVGQHVSKLMRVRKLAGKGDGGVSRQHLCVFATLEGGIGTMVPVSEKFYKRMYGLYSRMVNNLQHGAGLNPRGFRQIQARARPLTAAFSTATMGPPGPRSMLDGELLYQFASLGVAQQTELAKGIGSRIERILDDLVEVACGGEYF